MFRKGLLLAWLLAMAAVAPAQKRQVMLDRVVAVVGGSSILQSEVDEYAAQLTAQRRQEGYTSDRDPLNEALEDLLMQKLLYNQGVIDSVEISALDIQQRVEQHLQGMIEQEGSIAELEARHHMAVFNIREMLRQRYEERAYAEGMQHKIISRVTIVPGEVERFYKRTDRDSLPTIPEQYVYAQITKFPKSMKLAKQRAKERLLEMRERIITGQTRFDVMARMYSVDGSAITGGEMDPQPLECFVQPFADALGELRPGQISEVVETQFGFHLIQLIDKKGRLYHCRHILIRPDYTYEEEAEPTHILDSLATKIRQDSITFEKAALLYSDDVNSKMNGGIVSNADILERAGVFDAKYTQTKFLREDFGSRGYGKSLDDYNAIRKLQVGEISDAFPTEDMMGNKLSKIVKLVQVIPPHKASLNEDYIRLEQMALAAKQERVFREWLSRKIDGMYVYISPEYRDGAFENKRWLKQGK